MTPDENRIAKPHALEAVLHEAFEAFNARDLSRLRPLFHDEIVWPDTLDNNEKPLDGKEAVIGHFARMFATILANVQLIRILDETPDSLAVEAQYSVESPDGRIWTDTRAALTYHFKDGLLSGMTIVGGF